MDYSLDQIKSVLEMNGGIATAMDFQNAGIDRLYLYALLSRNILERESHGYYVLSESKPDEFKTIQNRSDKLVFSHATALFLNGMSDRVPHSLDITVPQGDNISRIKQTYSNTRFHYCKKEIWNLGIIQVTTPQGYSVKTYDAERCICDIIKDKKNIDTQIFTQAIKEYFSKRCDARKIIKYSRQMGIEQKIRTYMEVL